MPSICAKLSPELFKRTPAVVVDQDVGVVEDAVFYFLAEPVVFACEVRVELRGNFFFYDEVEGWVPRNNARCFGFDTIRTEEPLMHLVCNMFGSWSVRGKRSRSAHRVKCLEPIERVFEPVFVRVRVRVDESIDVSCCFLHCVVSFRGW